MENMIIKYNKSICTQLFLILLLLFSSSLPAYSQSITGKVISVADGDTITILTSEKEQIKIRLSAIDTPEKKQAYGQKAKDFTSSMVAGKNVTIEKETIDKYGRTVAMVLIDGLNLNKEIVKQGHGWVYRKYCQKAFCGEWLELEREAREAKIGLWADSKPVPPWIWRHGEKNNDNSSVTSNSVAVSGGTGGIYHGNQRSHVFHGSGCKDYNCKNCTVMLGSVNEAVGAGFRAHRECVNSAVR